MINLFFCCGNVTKKTFFMIFIGIDFVVSFIKLFYSLSVMDMRNDEKAEFVPLVRNIIFYIILFLALLNFFINKKFNGIFQKIYSWVFFVVVILNLVGLMLIFLLTFQILNLIFNLYLPFLFYYSYELMYATDCISTNLFSRNNDSDREVYNNIQDPIIIAD